MPAMAVGSGWITQWLITGSPIVGGLESGQLEVSDEQKKLNEAALGEKINQTPNGLNSGIVGLN
jgi:hypothetical protein